MTVIDRLPVDGQVFLLKEVQRKEDSKGKYALY